MQELIKQLQDLLKALIKIRPSEFFWNHLKHDIKQFREVTHRGVDDSALIVHLVLHKIMQLAPKEGITTYHKAVVPCPVTQQSHYPSVEESHPGILHTMDDRDRWERRFEALYINPVIQEVTSTLSKVQ